MSARRQRVGLIGYPVEHSLSPIFQQAAFDALELPIDYERWACTPEQVAERLDDIRAGKILGANVTVPHKELVFQLVDDTSLAARRAGAVNTVSLEGDLLFGNNTDVVGFRRSLSENKVDLDGATVMILGAGGAARGIVVALLSTAAKAIVIANRTVTRAEELRAALADQRIATCALADIEQTATQVDLLVNATAVGWDDAAPPVSASAFDQLPAGAVSYDLTYRGTPFLAAARARGLQTIDGLEMLVYQGAASFEIWTGKEAPVDVMMAAARAARG